MNKKILRTIPLVVLTLFMGCENNKEIKGESTPSVSFIKKIETMPIEKEIGCKENKSIKGCSEKKASTHILETLIEHESSTNYKNLRGELDKVLIQISTEKKKDILVKQELEALIHSVDSRENMINTKNELQALVGELNGKNSQSKELVDIRSELQKLITNRAIAPDKKEVKEKLQSLVSNISKPIHTLEDTSLNLKKLVDSAEKKGTKEVKQLASSVIEDISNHTIEILTTEDEFITIEVKKGESLSVLAERYYGDASKHSKIYEANIHKIGPNNEIYPGTTLQIPK